MAVTETPKPAKLAYNNTFWNYSYYKVAGLVWVRRCNKKFQNTFEMKESFEGIAFSLSGLPRERLKMLIDLRSGPQMRNDPEFEAIMLPYRRAMPEKFAKSAVLVRTAVGKLQVNRYNRQDNNDNTPIVCDTEEEALAWLGYSKAPMV
jgi:hypothetical protein